MVETGGVVVAAEMAKEVLKKVKSSVWPKEALEKVEERLNCFICLATYTQGNTHSSRHSILREVLNARETQLIGQLHK